MDNTFVAECLDIPVIVEGGTVEEVKEKMHVAIKGYFRHFPKNKIRLGKE